MCDQPHPLLIARIVENCLAANLDEAYNGMRVGRPGMHWWWATRGQDVDSEPSDHGAWPGCMGRCRKA